MANQLYPKAKEYFLAPLVSGTVKAIFVDSALYTYSATHQFLSDIPAGARIGTAQTLGSKTATNGVFDAADVTFTALTGASGEYLVIYLDTGTESTSPLIVIDDSGAGIPINPVGNDHVVQFHASGIFAL